MPDKPDLQHQDCSPSGTLIEASALVSLKLQKADQGGAKKPHQVYITYMSAMYIARMTEAYFLGTIEYQRDTDSVKSNHDRGLP